jgi:ATP-dependent helicase/nuclease subunit B
LFRLTSDLSDHIERGSTIVVPSRQRAHALRLAQAAARIAAGARVWTSADVLPLSAWERREVERATHANAADSPRILAAAEEWFLWRQCVLEATRGFELLDGDLVAEALLQSSELAADYRIALTPAPSGTETAVLASVQREFRDRCRALGASAVGMALEASSRTRRYAEGVAVRGFDALAPRLRALLPANAFADAGPAGTSVLRVNASDAQQELEHIVDWCRERLLRQPDARLLVMLPGAAGGRERLASLIRQALDPRSVIVPGEGTQALVGIEGGRPLSQRPMVSHALTTLGWLDGEELEFEALAAWLCAPSWTRPPAASRARLILALRERGFPALALPAFLGALQLLPASLQGAARELSAQLGRASAALGQGRGSPRLWAQRFTAALGAAGWPGSLTADGQGQQTLARWQDLLEEFGGLIASTPSLARDEALRALRKFAARTRFQPADEDVTVTVSPVLADPVVRYDGIWVAGLHADAFPQPVQPDAYLPLAAQLAAGVPAASATQRLRQARRLLAAWRAATDELVLSAPARAEDLELLPSPLLADFPAAGLPRPLHVWLPARLRRGGETELLIDVAGERWDPGEPLPRGTRSLDLQNLCPFRAYAELRLGASAPEVPEPGIAATARGVLLHAALQKLWEELGDSRRLGELAPAALDELIGACVAAAARATLLQPPGRRRRRRVADTQLDLFVTIPAIVARECRRAERLITRLCALERRRAPFRVELTEGHVELTLAGATLHMRLDRVDRLASGGRAILDYKTGQPMAADWYGDRPTHPQLLAYLCALGADVAALATVSVNARTMRFDGVARDAQLLPNVKAIRSATGLTGAPAWQAQQRAWRSLIERLIASFLVGEAAVDPVPGACRWCHVIDICRIAESAGADGVSAVGEGDDE